VDGGAETEAEGGVATLLPRCSKEHRSSCLGAHVAEIAVVVVVVVEMVV